MAHNLDFHGLRFMSEGYSIEEEVLACGQFVSLEVNHWTFNATMAVDQAYSFCVFFELVVRSVNAYSVNSSQIQLHWSVLEVAFKPAIEEASMDLV